MAKKYDEMYVPEKKYDEMGMYVPEKKYDGMGMYVPTKKTAGSKSSTEAPDLHKLVKQSTGMKSGGKVSSASKRADGCAVRGKTKGKMV
jgi:hypothetical protein